MSKFITLIYRANLFVFVLLLLLLLFLYHPYKDIYNYQYLQQHMFVRHKTFYPYCAMLEYMLQ